MIRQLRTLGYRIGTTKSSALQSSTGAMIFDPCSITMSLNGTNEAGVAVGTQTDLTGIHGFVMVPAPLIKNLPFDAIKVQLP